MNKNRWISGIFAFLIGALILIEIVIHFDIKEIVKNYASFSLYLIFLYVFISFSIATVVVLRWKYILKSYGHNVPFKDLFFYRTAAYAIGYVTPTAHIGGEPMKAYYLKKEHKVPMSKGISSVLIDRGLEFTGDALFAFIGFIILLFNFTISTKQTLLVVVLLVFLIAAVFFFYYSLFMKKGFFTSFIEKTKLLRINFFRRIYKFLRETEKNVNFFFRRRKKDLIIAIAYTAILWVLMFFEYKTALSLIGIEATAATIFIVLTFVAISYTIPVPAALGALEAGQISAFSLLSLAKIKAVAFSFLVRGRDLVWVTMGGIFILCKRRHIVNDIFKKKNDKSKNNKRRV